jgi:gliding motility-associated-like protein
MKKIVTCWVFLCGLLMSARADHITGGEMYYTLTGVANGIYNYHVTTKLFMDCYSNRRLPDPAIFGIFDKTTGERVKDITVDMTVQQGLELTNPGRCITNPPKVCYQIGYYDFDIPLPPSAMGYIIVLQVVYRIKGINNLINDYGNIGATYTCEIPGTSFHPKGMENYSAKFSGDDMVVVCANNAFSYDFGATDHDKDVLRYSFCNALIGGSGGGGTNNSPAPPPYLTVPYGSDYGPATPMGIAVKIDPETGMVTGIAPAEGIYVVTVCVEEIREGVVIATQRKDLQIRVTACTIASASIPPEYMLCKTSKTINLANASNSPLIISSNWEILNEDGNTIFSSGNAADNYTFPDIGTYKIKLVVNRNKECSDSTVSIARVYPGFIPGFAFAGICYSKPTIFTDTSKSQYGTVNSWKWDFGDIAVNDVSALKNPVYTYTSMGLKNIRLIATDSKGCRDTVFKNISIFDKPPITLAFRDTLICIPDPIQLKASGGGSFSWTPNAAMTNPNTPSPMVSPTNTTMYYVQLDDNGCLNRDSVRVRVVDHVDLVAMADSTICQGDTVRLHITSNGLKYSWTPESQVMNPTAANPFVITRATTTYRLIARIGSCTAREEVEVKTVPYPIANAGPDTTICYQTLAQLHGSTDGNSFAWLPSQTLNNRYIMEPYAAPVAPKTPYILSARDIKGCPKPGYDTCYVTMLPDINAFAGRDTSVIVGQPLRLQATGGIRYQWLPGTSLSNSKIANPVAVYNEPSAGIPYKLMAYNEAGCADSAFIRVKVYQAMPTVFVPNAFTPNNDRKNEVLKPLAVGIAKIDFFQVFNRWGQMVFNTVVNEKGWDGTVGGRQQPSGVYVWVVKATDFTGAAYVQRGTFMLIR